MDQETLAVITLGIALVGLLLSVINLVWQMVSWTYTGSKVKALLTYSFPVYGGNLGSQHICITARNLGRTQVLVSGFGIQLAADETVVMMQPLAWNPPLPQNLEAGHEQSWHMPEDEIRDQLIRRGLAGKEFPAYVTLGTGKRVFTKKTYKAEDKR